MTILAGALVAAIRTILSISTVGNLRNEHEALCVSSFVDQSLDSNYAKTAVSRLYIMKLTWNTTYEFTTLIRSYYPKY